MMRLGGYFRDPHSQISSRWRQANPNGTPVLPVFAALHEFKRFQSVDQTGQGGAVQFDPFAKFGRGDVVFVNQEHQQHALDGCDAQ